ncbi:MAG TPA: DUF5131 family protein [Pirellulales bacterium]|jgi:protein gp37
MAKFTPIQWTDSSVNPTMGCDGCELWNTKTDVRRCYAGVITSRFGKTNPGLANDFDVVELAPGRMAEAAGWNDLRGTQRAGAGDKAKPWLDHLPRLIFVSDMADALSVAVPFDYLRDEIIVNVASELGRRHHWQWLTKQPQRMAEFSAWLEQQGIQWPANLWVGTSITTQATTSRIRRLLNVGNHNTIRFLSVEPQEQAIDLSAYIGNLDWIIQGGESGPKSHTFDLGWARDIRDRCRTLGVPYFLKQLGRRVSDGGQPVKFKDASGGDWSEWPADLRVRLMPIDASGQKRRLSPLAGAAEGL